MTKIPHFHRLILAVGEQVAVVAAGINICDSIAMTRKLAHRPCVIEVAHCATIPHLHIFKEQIVDYLYTKV